MGIASARALSDTAARPRSRRPFPEGFMPKRAIRPVRTTRAATPRKAPARHARPATKRAGGYPVTLRTADRTLRFTAPPALAREAMQWTYRLRNRLRWKDSTESRRRLAQQSVDSLVSLGISEADLTVLAQASLIEVTVPWLPKGDPWEARVFPWEFMLASATRRKGRSGPLLVVRRLERRGAPAAPPPLGRRAPVVLFVESAPGALRDLYDFDSERELVRSALAPCAFQVCVDPSPEQLAAAAAKHQPDLVHLAGFDTHQGRELLLEQDPAGLPDAANDAEAAKAFERDGYLLGRGRQAVALPAEALAEALNSGRRPLRMVGCNLYSSAARIASMLIARGAGTALGFQDLQDDALMELFFGRFYRAWRSGAGDALAGFHAGWDALRAQPRDLQGTSVTLWSAASVVARARTAQSVVRRLAGEEQRVLAPPRTGALDWVQVEVEPREVINYALLHNHRSLFDRFLLHWTRPGRLTDVSVEVELMVGAERLSYRSTIAPERSPHDLSRDVRVPLAWSLARTLHESVRTTLYVDVRWQGRVLRRDTLDVTLLPVSEWHDTPEDDPWLPSFVLPRDPAVLRIVDHAQRYLVALDDDPTAGFDGYQSYDRADHGAAVDRRVQALWYALTQDLMLGYIDPPPTYSAESQRLRTPSEVLNGRRGTCIDLALLFASCLEFVDIYPVIFLRDDHAFPGYWRDPEAHDERFARMYESDDGGTAQGDDARGQSEAWTLGPDNYDEVHRLVHSGRIVPLETVDLTSRTSFEQACKDGRADVNQREGFASMLDIALARAHNVTPLPFPEGPTLERRPG